MALNVEKSCYILSSYFMYLDQKHFVMSSCSNIQTYCNSYANEVYYTCDADHNLYHYVCI